MEKHSRTCFRLLESCICSFITKLERKVVYHTLLAKTYTNLREHSGWHTWRTTVLSEGTLTVQNLRREKEIATFFMMVSRMMEKRAAVCLPPH